LILVHGGAPMLLRCGARFHMACIFWAFRRHALFAILVDHLLRQCGWVRWMARCWVAEVQAAWSGSGRVSDHLAARIGLGDLLQCSLGHALHRAGGLGYVD